MAKQEFTNSSAISTNAFTKGMIKDISASFQPNTNWSHARNVILNSADGDFGTIGNEPATLECGVVPYTIIGFIHKRADQWYIFSTDDVSSEIGFYDESTCSYTTIVNAPCLNFKKAYLITGAAKENFDCTWQIYFDDSNNPSRTLNVDDIPWVKRDISTPGSSCKIYEDTTVLDCEKLRLAPLMDTPCLTLSKASDGGLLRNGMYQAYIAYMDNDTVVTDYIGISNVQSLFDHATNGGSLKIELKNLDKDFDNYQLVILSNNQQQFVAKKIGKYSTEQSTVVIDFIDPSLETVSLGSLFMRKPAYEKSDAMYVVNDYLIRKGPTEQFDFNYQPLANKIKAQWVVAEYPADYYYNGGNKTSFMRDEVYSFFIRWIYNTGEKSKSYHIPGRYPKTNGTNQYNQTINETAQSNGINSVKGPNYNFEIYDTSTVVSLAQTSLPDGGKVIGIGDMGYWQSTELYPSTKPEIWNSTYVNPSTGVNIGGTTNTQFDLCGKPIRHHKMPTEERSPVLRLYDITTDSIRVLGVKFSDIERPKFNDGTYIPNIIGYEILRGSREGAKSILAKGVFRNMRKYTIPNNNSNLQGLYPNYPYNDLRPDIYFHDGRDAQDPGKRTDGCHSLTDSVNTYRPLTGYTKNVFTFHSPELMFKDVYLNASEARLYGELSGVAQGNFIKSEKHPQFKLLRNLAAVLAGLIGIGYTINALNGFRKTKIHYAYGDSSAQGGSLRGTTLGGVILAPASTPGMTTNKNSQRVAVNVTQPGTYAAGVAADDGATIPVVLTGNLFRVGLNATQASVQARVGSTAMMVGGSMEKEFEIKDESGGLPTFLQTILGILVSRQKIAEGAQKIIDLMYNLVKASDFVYKYNSHADIFTFKPTTNGERYRDEIIDQNYIGSSFQIFEGRYKINNLYRPKTVALSIKNEFNTPTPVDTDKSRFVIGGYIEANGSVIETNNYLTAPEVVRNSTVSMRYGALKFNFQNQYGQLEGIKQSVMRGCINLINNSADKFSTEEIFAGDTYVGRYTEKVIMPIFSDFLYGQPDEYTYDYLKRVNIPYPRFWINSQKYDTTNLADEIATLGFKDSTGVTFPNDLFYLDRGNNTCSSALRWIFSGDPNPAFAMRYAYMYTHCNGILDFFVESEINLAQRDWEETPSGRHYDAYSYNDVDDLFDAAIIKKDNVYKYDYSLSASRFITNLTSFGEMQARDYNPQIAETCFDYYPNRLIYSLQARNEIKKDFWRVFLPNNYRDFSQITTIKPINQTGAIIFYPYASPQLFQGVDRLETDLGVKLTIGDGGLFSQPLQNVTNSDLSNEYGSCESARSIVNTPYGLFFISQQQGKIFMFANSLVDISNYGMVTWLSKYLPSVLKSQFPQIEESVLYDNPVIGIGCQSVYDINYDIVYFSKKDYSVKPQFKANMIFNSLTNQFVYTNQSGVSLNVLLGDPAFFDNVSWTLSFSPKSKSWVSFHDWFPELSIPSTNHFLTTKTSSFKIPYCPPGYIYNFSTQLCERLTNQSAPAIVTVQQEEVIITSTSESCLFDVIIAVDSSASTGDPNSPGSRANAEVTFVEQFINNVDVQNGLNTGKIQIGVVSWSSIPGPPYRSMQPNGYSMSNTLTATQVTTWLKANWLSTGTDIPTALTYSQLVMDNKVGSQLGDRTLDPDFKQYIVLITDTETIPPVDVGCPFQSSTLGGSTAGPANQFVAAVYCGATSPIPLQTQTLPRISCNQSAYQFAIAANNYAGITAIVNGLFSQLCNQVSTCSCPPGYTIVYPNTTTTPLTYTMPTGTCPAADGKNPICRKVTCNCPPPPVPGAVTTQSGVCDDIYLVGNLNYVNQNPVICNYYALDVVPSSLTGGSIWRHNYRCDLYSNYYTVNYPWEIEFTETTGQAVSTLRNVEYQLEAYVYKGDLQNGCADDRWQDLDFNFDEAIIYNTEQVSGLLKLELNAKENPYLNLNYPIIGANDIRILYSKEEQKYRFNQFWDVTKDRGEFTNVEEPIFITKLNGYIKELNTNNLNYQKAEDQRKKFRNYYNKIFLRKNVSGNRKMLLKAFNTKLLNSYR